jgi:quercetin dioxygenase-like cupin family protein
MSDDGSKWTHKRYVVGSNSEGKSAVLQEEATNVIKTTGIHKVHRADLWSTAEMPVDNTIPGDRALESKTREPRPNGTVFRALELGPNAESSPELIEEMKKFHQMVGQKHMPTDEDYKRHFTMHRTDSVDYLTCVIGEVWLVTDVDEVLMRPGDSVVVTGTNHAWVNRSDKPCLVVGAMIDAKPLD